MTTILTQGEAMKVEREQIQKQFSAASHSYDHASRLQRVTGKKLIADNCGLFTAQVLDLGCGTGINTQMLSGLTTNVTGCDLAFDMIKKTHQLTAGQVTCVQGDAQNLPFANDAFSLIYSNLMLQWFDDLRVPLREIRRVLKPHRPLLFTTLLDGTLHELKSAWAAIDNDNHVNTFSSLTLLEAALQDSGFNYQIEVKAVELDYESVLHLARELKHLGANYVKGRNNKGLMGKQKWLNLAQHYQQFQKANKAYPATYQVAYVRATIAGDG